MQGFEDPGLREETLLEHTTPHGGILPPHLLTNRPFLWLVLGEGVASLSFWSLLAAVFSEASFHFDATPTQMSIMLGAFSVPFLVFMPLQGILVDRWSPKWLNIAGYLPLIAAAPVAISARSIVWLYAATLLIGLSEAAVQPARSSLIGLLVEEDRLVQANGMRSAVIQLGLVAGPLAGGVAIRTLGVEAVYWAAVVVGVASLPFFALVPDRRQGGERPAVRLSDLGDGVRTVFRHPDLRLLLFMAVAMYIVTSVFFALEPLFIKNTLKLSKDAVSFLWSGHGLGAMIGAIFVARTRAAKGRELALIGAGFAAAGLGVLLYMSFAMYPTALVGTAIMGGGFSFYYSPALALIQREAGEEQRGRVTSVFGVLQEGMALVTSLTVAALGVSAAVVRPTLVGTGLALSLVGLFGLRALARRREEPAFTGHE